VSHAGWKKPAGNIFDGRALKAGLPDGIFSNQYPNLGNFGRDCNEYVIILWPFGLFYFNSVYFVAIWCILHMVIGYIFSCFGILYQGKSVNPDK
jgi:hypothetical protein